MSASDAPPRSSVGWALVAASVTGLAALLRFMNPWTGVAARRWPWQLDLTVGWTRNVATLVFFAALVFVPLVAAFRPPGRRRGIFVATAVALALTALADIAIYLYGVETYVPPLLGAIVAGGLWAARGTPGGGAGRVVAGVAGAVLIGLLLYPQGSNTKPDPRKRNPDQDYRAILPVTIDELSMRVGESDEDRRRAAEAGLETHTQNALEFATAPWSMGVWLAALIGLLGVFAAFRPTHGWTACTALFLFLFAAAYPPIWYGMDAWRNPGRIDPNLSPLAAAALAFAHSLREQYAPFLLALFAATVDLTRGTSGDPVNP